MALARVAFLLAAAAVILPVYAEKRRLDLILPPSDDTLHYAEGFIRAPGYIDMTDISIKPISDPIFDTGDGGFDNSDFYDDNTEDEDDLMPDDGGGQRRLDSGFEPGESYVDLVIFRRPDDCAKSRKGCDWPKIGVGKSQKEGTRYCCTAEASTLGYCDSSDVGRLIVDIDTLRTVGNGDRRPIKISPTSDNARKISAARFEEDALGQYIIVLANCDMEHGRTVQVSGETIWKSEHGYLPGELYNFMLFYGLLGIIYVVLLVWYLILMKINAESRIPIEKWICMTIAMGTVEMVLRSFDNIAWNATGVRSPFYMHLVVLMGSIRRGISRTLVIMVALGWGVVRDSLGSTMRTIIFLGTAYVITDAMRDLLFEYTEDEMAHLNIEDIEGEQSGIETEIDIIIVLTFVVAAIDVTYIMWILDAFNATMEYLENMSQNRKLQRYLQLRLLFLCSVLFATIWVVFSLVDNFDENGIVQEEHEWIVEAATEVNYLFVLVGIAWMWRPNPSAKEYAYVMELPALGGEDGENELELTGVVPSAMDDDDEEGPKKGADGVFVDDGADGHDNRFQID